jgi:hypothetical protein
MFRRLAALIGNGGAAALFQLHPAELMALLELAWNIRTADPGKELGHPDRRSDLDGLPHAWLDPLFPPPVLGSPPSARNFAAKLRDAADKRPVMWDHLIYAYMIENTRIYEIFRRVVREFLHGEKLGVPAERESRSWLRNTEELFYKDPAPFAIGAITSHARADLDATRRNAYERMFGMDLNHGTEDNKPYPYRRGDIGNREFVATFEEFLREVWVGMVNFAVTSGPRPTDNEKIANLARKLHDMLISRRLHGNLSREEFWSVSMMSWFHLTVESDAQIIKDLKAAASGAGPEQRLFRIAQLVGLPAHGLSHSYFDIADAMSLVLLDIEAGQFNTAANARFLYEPIPESLEPRMRVIVNHWSIITGRDVKAGKVATT